MRGWWSLDAWLEVIERLLGRPLRTGLTAFSVAWGVFMLVLLLAAGDGLENSMRHSFRDDAINSIWVYAGQTALPHAGHPVGRKVQLTDADTHQARALPEAGYTTARFIPPNDLPVSRGGRVSTFDIRSTHPEHRHIEGTQMEAGRFLNDRDVAERRKVAVLGRPIAEFLFPGADPLAAPLGEEIQIGDVVFTVVGVFSDDGSAREEQIIYLPITTAQAAFGGRDQVDMVLFTVGPPDIDAASLADADRALASIKAGMAARHGFDPSDPGALRIRDRLRSYADVQDVFVWLRGFTWVVGLGTLLAAMVGVGNTLLISVKERTRELGLRKALGARPGDLVGLVLQEAFVLTATAGWGGLVVGLGLLEAVRRFVPTNDYLRDPDVELSSVVAAAVALTLSGVLAGLVPALRAARIEPVVALQDE